MTRRLVGAFVAAALAPGFLGGTAGTIVAQDAAAELRHPTASQDGSR